MRILYISSKRAEEKDLLMAVPGLEMREINFHLRSSIGIKLFRKICEIINSVKEFSPELFLMESVGVSSAIAAVLGSAYNIPFAVRVKGDFWTEYAEVRHGIPLSVKIAKLLNYWAGLWVLRNSLAIFPIAEHLHALIERNLGMRKRMFTVHNTPEMLEPGPGLERGIDNEKFVVTVTNFNFWNKVKPLAEAVSALTPLLHKHGFKWFILGDGLHFEKFRRIIMELIDSGTVVMPGWKSPYWYYREAKALFYISGMDGLPNVLLEAMSLGVPVIMDRDCPAADFVKDGYNGLVVEFSDKEKVEAVLKRIISDEVGFKEMAKVAKEYMLEEYSVKKISEEMREALIKSLES